MTKELDKISVKTLGYSETDLKELAKEGRTFLARLGGLVNSYFTGQSQYGEWVGFKGVFHATTAKGEEITSTVIHLPNALANATLARFQSSESGTIEFIADVYVTKSPKGAYFVDAVPPMSEKEILAVDAIAKRMKSIPMPVNKLLENKSKKSA